MPERPNDGADMMEPPKGRYLWCLDNGHGEATPGKRSGLFEDEALLYEYEFNRELNQRIMAKLDKAEINYYNVVPEIEGDIPLYTRVRRANGKKTNLPGGKIYISIHANASTNKGWDNRDISGIETWFYADSDDSMILAMRFQNSLVEHTGANNRGIRCHQNVSKSFYVLRKTKMPAILVENGFYTNRKEARYLRSGDYQDLLANGYLEAIKRIEREGLMVGVEKNIKPIKI